MILNDIEEQLQDQVRDGLIYPQFGGYCLSSIPDTIRYLFGIEKSSPLAGITGRAGIEPVRNRKVVSILLDAFGWDQWQRYSGDYGLLQRLTERGALAPVTSVFPSATPVVLSSLHSGLTPQQNGIPSSSMYYPEFGKVISVLRSVPMDGTSDQALPEFAAEPGMIYSGVTFYESLGKSGIPSCLLTHKSIEVSPFASALVRGAQTMPYIWAEGLEKTLYDCLVNTPAPAYFSVYWGIIDKTGHAHGIHSPEYLEVLDMVLPALERVIDKLPSGVAEETVLLVFADHGHINLDPGEPVWLNDHPNLLKNLRIGTDGRKIPPWDDQRCLFLALEEDRIEETIDYVASEMAGAVSVMRSKDALQNGLFGIGEQHPLLESRLGDIILMAKSNLIMMYRYPGMVRNPAKGSHGGLTVDEMLVPFAAAKISDLR